MTQKDADKTLQLWNSRFGAGRSTRARLVLVCWHGISAISYHEASTSKFWFFDGGRTFLYDKRTDTLVVETGLNLLNAPSVPVFPVQLGVLGGLKNVRQVEETEGGYYRCLADGATSIIFGPTGGPIFPETEVWFHLKNGKPVVTKTEQWSSPTNLQGRWEYSKPREFNGQILPEQSRFTRFMSSAAYTGLDPVKKPFDYVETFELKNAVSLMKLPYSARVESHLTTRSTVEAGPGEHFASFLFDPGKGAVVRQIAAHGPSGKLEKE